MVKKSYAFIFTSAIAATSLISGCSNKKDYEEQINHYVNNLPACVSVPFKPYSWTSGEMPNDVISVKISIPKTNLDDERLERYNTKINAMDTLVKLGFFTKGKTDDNKDNFFHSENIRTTYVITELGLKEFDKGENDKPKFGQLCFGSIKIDSISDPIKSAYGDLTGENVTYNWSVVFDKDYAKESGFIKGFNINTSGENSLFFTKGKDGGFIAFPINNNKINMLNTLQLNGFSGQLNENLNSLFSDDF